MRVIGVRLDHDDIERLREIAAKEERSISFIIRRCVVEFLRKQGEAA